MKDKTGRWYNKIFRRVNKMRVKCGKEPLLMKELIDDWDVCDWKAIWTKHDIKAYDHMTEEDVEIAKRK